MSLLEFGACGAWNMPKKNKCKGCSLEELDPYKKIHEDTGEEGFLLNYAINPEVDGHLVVQPIFHAGQLCDLNEKQAGRLMKIIWASCKALQTCLSPQKIYVYSFNETKGYHLHFHIKPKIADVPVRGSCFVNWTDPKLEKLSKAAAKKHHEGIIMEIKKSKYIKRL